MSGTCRGIDVSEHQATQDWGAHKAAGIVFAVAKATEGEHTRDSKFTTHITGIKAAGLVPGAYHFGWPSQDPAAEAANYAAAVKPYAGTGFTHWLDLERYSDGRNYAGCTAQQIHDWAARWIQLAQAAFPGQRVGVYSGSADIAAGHVPAGVPLWYPAYPGTSVDTFAEAEARLRRPAPSGRSPLIWQFTSTPASGPALDLDLCYMNEASLRAWAAGNENDVSLTTEQAAQLQSIFNNLLNITSLTEQDSKTGAYEVHGAGYYLATLDQTTRALAKALTAVQAQSASNGAQLTKALTALSAISTAVSAGGSADSIVAAVKAALAAWHPTITIGS